jgi:hypothetical protein
MSRQLRAFLSDCAAFVLLSVALVAFMLTIVGFTG